MELTSWLEPTLTYHFEVHGSHFEPIITGQRLRVLRVSSRPPSPFSHQARAHPPPSLSGTHGHGHIGLSSATRPTTSSPGSTLTFSTCTLCAFRASPLRTLPRPRANRHPLSVHRQDPSDIIGRLTNAFIEPFYFRLSMVRPWQGSALIQPSITIAYFHSPVPLSMPLPELHSTVSITRSPRISPYVSAFTKSARPTRYDPAPPTELTNLPCSGPHPQAFSPDTPA